MLAGYSLDCSVLMKGLTKLKFAILHSGTTIYDRGRSERSNAIFKIEILETRLKEIK